jgi:hypothetical protein
MQSIKQPGQFRIHRELASLQTNHLSVKCEYIIFEYIFLGITRERTLVATQTQIEIACMDNYGNPIKRLVDVYMDREPFNGELMVTLMVPHGHAKLLRQPQGPALR